jgi:quinol monooxygenase YgiN
MAAHALFVRHKTQPGRRDDVRTVWERHMRPSIESNPGHDAYFYGFDDNDPDSICAFQQYASVEASRAFLETAGYAAYLADVTPLLAGPPEVAVITPVWVKGA